MWIWGKKKRGNSGSVKQRRNASPNQRCRNQNENYFRLIHSIANTLDSTQAQEQADDNKRAFREKIVICLLIGTIVVSTGGDVIFYFTMHYARQAAVEAHADNVSALEQAKIANDATDQRAQETLVESSRAWLGATDASIDGVPTVGKDITATIVYVNPGRQPARDVYSDVTKFFATPIDDIRGVIKNTILNYVTKCIATPTQPNGQIVFPSTGFSTQVITKKILKDSVDADVVSGSKIVYLQGCFAYLTFEKPHHTAFCYFFQSGTSNVQHLSICPIGNYSD
ncbi:MAG TPA: hypothetical protein VGR52_09520 [Stellaceae bacterium]|nr:hypothetical protein [Stellaceae bacterium]